jgi:hypothetical protein
VDQIEVRIAPATTPRAAARMPCGRRLELVRAGASGEAVNELFAGFNL